MSTIINRQFLDQEGLRTFWGKINDAFPRKGDVISTVNFESDSDNVTLEYTKANGDTGSVAIPNADENRSGVISSEFYNFITDLQGGSGNTVPFTGMLIDGKQISLSNRTADVKLKLVKENDGKLYLSLIDSRFADGSKWETITYDEWKNATNNGSDPKIDYCYSSPFYYKWVGVGNSEPAYNKTTPIITIPESKIDVTAFVKTGLLKAAGYNSSTYELVFTFYTYENGVESETEERINIKDFIDIYNAGTGISIDSSDAAFNDTDFNVSVINLKTASTTEIGGVKINKDNGFKVDARTSELTANITQHNNRYIGVEIDSDDKAFVYVPWYNIEVDSDDAINSNYGLQLDSNTSTLKNTISLGVHAKSALENADSAIQQLSILGSTLNQDNPTLSVDAAKAALNLKSAAYVDTITVIDEATVVDDSKLPTVSAIKSYVNKSTNDSTSTLTKQIEASEYTITRTGYDAAYNSQNVRCFYNALSQKNGVLEDNDGIAISIYDIADFTPLTSAQINDICK